LENIKNKGEKLEDVATIIGSDKAEQFEKANLILEEALMVENFARTVDKYGYQAGLKYIAREVKEHAAITALETSATVQISVVIVTAAKKSPAIRNYIVTTLEGNGFSETARSVEASNRCNYKLY
ncbi:hypothetical protein AB4F11_05270, partial [Francisella philomiragia]